MPRNKGGRSGKHGKHYPPRIVRRKWRKAYRGMRDRLEEKPSKIGSKRVEKLTQFDTEPKEPSHACT